MMKTKIISDMLDILADGEWHSLYELDIHLPNVTWKIIATVHFLGEFDFVERKTNNNGEVTHVKAVPSVVEFIKQIQKVENNE